MKNSKLSSNKTVRNFVFIWTAAMGNSHYSCLYQFSIKFGPDFEVFFSDSIPILKTLDIPVYVPPLKQEIGKTQKSKSNTAESNPIESQKIDMKRTLTRAEADEQRFTTAIRWIVEVN